jgi:hypothetical protein
MIIGAGAAGPSGKKEIHRPADQLLNTSSGGGEWAQKNTHSRRCSLRRSRIRSRFCANIPDAKINITDIRYKKSSNAAFAACKSECRAAINFPTLELMTQSARSHPVLTPELNGVNIFLALSYLHLIFLTKDFKTGVDPVKVIS